MANFKNQFATPAGSEVTFDLGGANGAVNTGKEITIIGLTCANKSAASTDVTIRIYIAYQGTAYYLIKDAPIPVGSSLVALDGKLVLGAGNIITVSSTHSSTVDAILSYLEITP
jgi:hypothetical protein